MSYLISDKHLIMPTKAKTLSQGNSSVPNIMVYVIAILFIRSIDIFAKQRDKFVFLKICLNVLRNSIWES